MIITEIKLRNFRNYRDAVWQPHPGVNLLFGANGSGKTNLIEAIHYCALGRSHRINQDAEAVLRGESLAAVAVSVQKRLGRRELAMKLTPNLPRKKTFYAERKKLTRLMDLMGQLQVVIFSPEDLNLVKSGPSLRRRLMDMVLSQLEPRYFLALQQVQQAMEQRNMLLKQMKKTNRRPDDQLLAFEQAMAEPTAVIVHARRRLTRELMPAAESIYHQISARPGESFLATYASVFQSDDPAGEMISQCARRREEDLLRGQTSFGIHREDLSLTLNRQDMRTFASQGQIRTAALALKLAQIELFRSRQGEAPVLLLDDVMSELDLARREQLLTYIDGNQTFITCTDRTDLLTADLQRTYRISLNENREAMVEMVTAGQAVEPEAEIEDPDFS